MPISTTNLAEVGEECSGKYCSFDSDCNVKNFCCPKARKCIQIGMYDPCEFNHQCPEHSKCHPLLLRCYPTGPNHENNIEWNLVDGVSCRSDAHCHRDSYCKNGVCASLPILFESCKESLGMCRRPFICSSKTKTCRMPCWTNFDCQQNYKWWVEANKLEGTRPSGQRLDCIGSDQSLLTSMCEGNQGFSAGLNHQLQPPDHFNTLCYEWCNQDGNYCDVVPGPTSFRLILLALIPLLLVVGIFIFCKVMKTSFKKKEQDNLPEESADEYPEF